MSNDSLTDALTTLEETIVTTLTDEEDTQTPLAMRRYDYTALSTARTCPRKYVLEHVLDLPEHVVSHPPTDVDSQSDTGPGTTAPSTAIREGQLFHLVAEHHWPATREPSRWHAYAAQVAESQGWQRARERVEALIEAFLDSEVGTWTVDRDRVEVPFSFEFQDVEVTGLIDALPTTNDGDVVVLDYKTGQAPDGHEQLLIYLLATRLDDDLPLDHPPTDAMFVIVDEYEVSVERLNIADMEATLDQARTVLRNWIQTAKDAQYDDPRPGSHCSQCPYRGICAAAPSSAP
jgi:CRISPR/Cas system-associated exonuclease Cas4 (RecB family)